MSVAAVFAPQLRQVHSVGFGCCMLRRNVLEHVKLREYQGGNASEDIFFCIDAHAQGFKIFLDTTVWVKHHFWKRDDSRNRFLTREWNEQQRLCK